NLKSLFVLAVAAVTAYRMIYTDSYQALFGWTQSFTVALDAHGIPSQSIGALAAAVSGGDAATLNAGLSWALAGALAIWAFASADFRRNPDQLLGGIGFGLAVLAGWWLTAGPRAAARPQPALALLEQRANRFQVRAVMVLDDEDGVVEAALGQTDEAASGLLGPAAQVDLVVVAELARRRAEIDM
ncbi:hypothetical protein, partial [Marinobacter mobilis]|uniref:hypothetical protein n=1 Tax=Marinobacter mobilis TaxID=488533 RepID=UPI0035C6BF31